MSGGSTDRRRRREGILGAGRGAWAGVRGRARPARTVGGVFWRRPRGARPRHQRQIRREEPQPLQSCVPQPRLYPRIHHRPLCVSAPAPEAPQPAALSSLIGSAEGFTDWLPSRSAWSDSAHNYWSPELLLRPPRDVIARTLGVPGSSSGKPRVLLGSRLRP